ncbi:hypothetical protein P153DRAFT_75916 [Dothidotthia symphoricarpi CBS 119687]|uniref:Uncharacterized protein n=1 Tax=Dothidotthia symphoricarpi CBS 119687 TaxID=1392245 RepID=A0A6A6A398_9PLEO|nr:uncharacterized protein P153DRAFT_75916 [Dothidotthia symphoricarpi CBS 119687]KAF2126349.1 hypothetical protein P153DRAFT_75916 [Dothidotthia symphoricarpi CBS 119687]
MPPHIRSTIYTEMWATSNGVSQLFKALVLVSAFMTSSRDQPQYQEKDPKIHQPAYPQSTSPRLSHEPNQNDHLYSIPRPIYPWTSPPASLPGPYDTRYYPLPTIRRHSYDPSTTTPDEISTVSFTRRISINSISACESILNGTTATSSEGWRRTQWTVSGG